MSELANEEKFSNFQLFGIGKPSAKQSERRDKRKEFREHLKDEAKHGHLGRAIVNRMQVANPAAAIPRAAFIGLVRLNFAGVSSRLYPAFLTEEELVKGHFDVPNGAKAKEAWKKVSNIWELLGGNPKGLEKYIRMSHDHPVFHTKKEKARERHEKGDFTQHFDAGSDLQSEITEMVANATGYSNYGDGGASAYIAAGGSVLVAVIGAIGKAAAKKNPYAEGSEKAKSYDTAGTEMADLTPEQKSKVEEIMKVAADDKARGVPLGEGDDASDKILGMPKGVAITVFIVGGLLLAFGGYKLYKHFNK